MRNRQTYEPLPVEDNSNLWDFVSETDDDPDYREVPVRHRRARYSPQQNVYEQSNWSQQERINLASVPLTSYVDTNLPEYAAPPLAAQHLLTPPDNYGFRSKHGYAKNSGRAGRRLELPSPVFEPLPPSSTPADYVTNPNYQLANNYQYVDDIEQDYGVSDIPTSSHDRQYLPPIMSYLAGVVNSMGEPSHNPAARYHSPPSPGDISAGNTEHSLSPPDLPVNDKSVYYGVCKDMKVKLPKFAPKSQIGSFGKINMRAPGAWKRSYQKRARKIKSDVDSEQT